MFMKEFTTNDLNKWVENILAGNATGSEGTDGIYIPELKITYGTKLMDWFIGPDTIFSGRIPSLNANIFKAQNRAETDILKDVSEAVAKFYVILRNIAAIVMLAGLLYTGIQILLSSNIPTKKTQYLMLLQDWLIGMALLIFSHVIMILIFEMTDSIVNALSVTIGEGSIKWQLIKTMGGSFESTAQLTALILYHWIQILTIIFAIAYFKRFFWTCILTVFAPVMCVMYAFGQHTKQIYSNWLKEYIVNAFVQPFHMVVYTVLIGIPLSITNEGGWNWSGQNQSKMIYALMAMSMIRPAEKYLRRLFGMDKGVANMASYDSGMKTVTDIGKAAIAVAKTAAAVYTGGATAMAGGAMSSLGSAAASAAGKGAASGLGEGLSEAGEALGEGISEAGASLGEGEEGGDVLGEGDGGLPSGLSPDPTAPTLGAGDGVDDFTPDEVNQLGKTITDGIENSNERIRISTKFS